MLCSEVDACLLPSLISSHPPLHSLSFIPLNITPTQSPSSPSFPDTLLPPPSLSSFIVLSPHLLWQHYAPSASSSPPGSPSSVLREAPVAHHPAIPPLPAEITVCGQTCLSLCDCVFEGRSVYVFVCLYCIAHMPCNHSVTQKVRKMHLAGSCTYLT